MLGPLQADPIASGDGLGGHGLAHQHAVFAVIAVLFGVLVAALLIWLRRASRAAEIEELDRLLDGD